ncbi:MAG: toxin-antitoxin system TumE family protein [Thermodesulfovibrionales bacterium]
MTSRNKIYSYLKEIALSDFADIVEGTVVIEGKLRILLKDESFVDVWLSVKKKGVYAYHWERKNIDGTIYRYNNLPDKEAKKLQTYPKHFHNKTEENVVESDLSNNPEEAIRVVLEFARRIIKT